MANWTPENRASMRALAARSTGPLLWADATADLLDLLTTVENRAAMVDGLQARLDAVAALHRPEPMWGPLLGCATCQSGTGDNEIWPCATAEAMSARGEA